MSDIEENMSVMKQLELFFLLGLLTPFLSFLPAFPFFPYFLPFPLPFLELFLPHKIHNALCIIHSQSETGHKILNTMVAKCVISVSLFQGRDTVRNTVNTHHSCYSQWSVLESGREH